LKILSLACLLAYGYSVCAAGAPGKDAKSSADQFPAWRTEAVRVLAARPDANSLATAAALRSIGPTASAPDLSARASELAPQSAAIGWLHLQLCAAAPNCDTRDVATVLRWVDPDNSAAWMSALITAQKDKDAIEVDRIMADMARGTRFDLYYNQLIVLMFDALTAVRHQLTNAYASSDSVKLTLLTDIASAEIVPAFSALVNACRESAPASERREDCLKTAKLMQHGDTIIVQTVGFGMEKRLVSADSKEARALGERRQLLEWRVTASDTFDLPLLPWTRNSRARARLAEMRLRPRQEDVCIALLRDHKMPLEPPESH
jgi:hypothetical protein